MTAETLIIQDSNSRKGRVAKCAKCGVTAEEEPSLRFHRIPLPRSRGSLRTRAWAEYIFPDKDWTCEQDLVKLYNMNTMLCGKHFDDSAYTNSSKTRLNVFALPSEAADTREFEKINQNQRDHNYAVGIYRAPVGIKSSTARRPNAGPSVATIESRQSPSTAEKSPQDSATQRVGGVKNNHALFNSGRLNNAASTSCSNVELNQVAVTTDSGSQQNANHEDRECDGTEADVLQEDGVEVKEEQDEPTLTRVCRVCLRYCSDAQEMTPLLRDGKLTEAGNALTAFCPQVKITVYDNLPVQICDACTREAIRAERFYRRVEETHARLATLVPQDIVQYSLSLKHYFPERTVADKLGEDDEAAVISLRYDGDQHLELSFNNEPSTTNEVEAAREKPEAKTSDEEMHKFVVTTQKTARKQRNIFSEKPNRITQSNGDANDEVIHDAANLEYDEESTQLLRMEDVSVKDEPFEDSETEMAQTEMEAGCDQFSPEFATEVDTTFVCPECNTDFVTCLEAEQHMQSAHGPVPAYVCYECSQTITSKQLLREHLLRHSGVKPYKCQRCHNWFYSRRDRRRHYVMCAVKSANVY